MIDHELDILQFLRNQFAIKAMKKMLFTKVERYLLHSQADPLVINSKGFQLKSNFDDTEFNEDFRKDTGHSKYYQRLVKGVYGPQ